MMTIGIPGPACSARRRTKRQVEAEAHGWYKHLMSSEYVWKYPWRSLSDKEKRTFRTLAKLNP